MADTNNNGETPQRSDSNLPILFANGYPTSLKNMKMESLELFLPFLAECVADAENVPPKWWPHDLQFKFPLERPRRFKNNDLWESKLRDVVKACYITSGNEYLLIYSENLSAIPTDKLQLITESNLTTSLYKKESGGKKLLITFRNENMTYDKRKRLQLWHKAQPSSMISPSPEPDESEATFQIILCDYCDSEFYSDEAFEIHEMRCRDRVDSDQEQDDPEENIVDKIVISDDDEADTGSLDYEMESMASGGQANFMAYFGLANSKTMELPKRSIRSLERSISPKKRSRTRTRTRKVVNKKEIENERAIPFSSPAGQVILKKQRLDKEVDDSYAKRRYEEVKGYCKAKPLMKIPPRTKMKQPVTENNAVFREMRKPRHFYWPKRQLNSRSKTVNFEFLNRSLIEETVPATIVLDKLSNSDVNRIIERFRQRREEKKRREEANCIAVLDSDDDDDDDDGEYENDGNKPSTSGLGNQSYRCMLAHTNSISFEKRDSTTKIFSSNHEISIISQTSQSRHTVTSAPINSQLSIQGLNATLDFDHGNPTISNNSSQIIEDWLQNVG